jgi:hypothetical protein
MINIIVAFLVGTGCGVYLERVWLRALYKQMGFIRRQQRGGAKRRRR